MSAPSVFSVCALVRDTTWYAITLRLATTSSAAGVALRLVGYVVYHAEQRIVSGRVGVGGLPGVSPGTFSHWTGP